MLAEDHIPNSVLGETMDALITDQFVRLRDGDPFYYENDAELTEVKIELKTTHLADIILRNTEIESIQCDVFFAEHNVNNLDCHLANAEMSEEIVEEEGFSTLILGLILVGVTGLLIMNYVGAKEAEEEE